MTTLPALFISFNSSIDPDYIRAFVPTLMDHHIALFSTAVIIPLATLHDDQIAFLRAQGAKDVLATERLLVYRVETREQDGLQKHVLEGVSAEVKRDHYICAFNLRDLPITPETHSAAWEVSCYTVSKDMALDESA